MKMKMSVDDAIELADEWSRGMTIHEGSRGWRVACMILADAVRDMRRRDFICQNCGKHYVEERAPGLKVEA